MAASGRAVSARSPPASRKRSSRRRRSARRHPGRHGVQLLHQRDRGVRRRHERRLARSCSVVRAARRPRAQVNDVAQRSQGFPIAADTVRRRKRARRRTRSTIGRSHRSARAPRRSEINVTPLVDVVLVLLIIFMVVTPMLHRGVKIELPETVHHDAEARTPASSSSSACAQDGMYIDTDRVGDTPTSAKTRIQHPTRRTTLVARLKKELQGRARPCSCAPTSRSSTARCARCSRSCTTPARSTVSHGTEEAEQVMAFGGGWRRRRIRHQHHAARRRGARAPHHLHGHDADPVKELSS